jgi:hypothetical protein
MGIMSMTDPAPLPRLGEVFFDVRSKSRSLRISWYADTGVAVLSIWQGGTCTGSFRLPMGDLPRLIGALQAGPPGWDGPGDNGAPGAGGMAPPAGYAADPDGSGSLHYLAGSAPMPAPQDQATYGPAPAAYPDPAAAGFPGYATADPGGYPAADPGRYQHTDSGSHGYPAPAGYPAADSGGYPAPGGYAGPGPAGPGSGSYPGDSAGYATGFPHTGAAAPAYPDSGAYPDSPAYAEAMPSGYASRHGDPGYPAEAGQPDYLAAPTAGFPPAAYSAVPSGPPEPALPAPYGYAGSEPYGHAGPENLHGQQGAGWDYRPAVSVGAGLSPLPESHPYGTPHENHDRRDETPGPPVPFG